MTTSPNPATVEPVSAPTESQPIPQFTGQSPEDYEKAKWAKDSWFMRDRYPGAGFVRFAGVAANRPVLIRDSAVEVIEVTKDGGSFIHTKGCGVIETSEPPIDVARLLATPYHLALDDDQPFGTEAGADRINQAAAEEDVRILRDGVLALAKRHLDWEHLGSQQDSERLLRLADFAEGSAHLVLASRLAEHVPGLDVVMATMRFDVECMTALWRRAAVECQKAERGDNQEAQADAFQVALAVGEETRSSPQDNGPGSYDAKVREHIALGCRVKAGLLTNAEWHELLSKAPTHIVQTMGQESAGTPEPIAAEKTAAHDPMDCVMGQARPDSSLHGGG